jgi:hypothetical protein
LRAKLRPAVDNPAHLPVSPTIRVNISEVHSIKLPRGDAGKGAAGGREGDAAGQVGIKGWRQP